MFPPYCREFSGICRIFVRRQHGRLGIGGNYGRIDVNDEYWKRNGEKAGFHWNRLFREADG